MSTSTDEISSQRNEEPTQASATFNDFSTEKRASVKYRHLRDKLKSPPAARQHLAEKRLSKEYQRQRSNLKSPFAHRQPIQENLSEVSQVILQPSSQGNTNIEAHPPFYRQQTVTRHEELSLSHSSEEKHAMVGDVEVNYEAYSEEKYSDEEILEAENLDVDEEYTEEELQTLRHAHQRPLTQGDLEQLPFLRQNNVNERHYDREYRASRTLVSRPSLTPQLRTVQVGQSNLPQIAAQNNPSALPKSPEQNDFSPDLNNILAKTYALLKRKHKNRTITVSETNQQDFLKRLNTDLDYFLRGMNVPASITNKTIEAVKNLPKTAAQNNSDPRP